MREAQGTRSNAAVDAATAAPSAAAREALLPRPLDLTTPQFTLRAVLTGMALGGLLSTCNVYTGLTIGWGLNMSATSILLSYGFWMTVRQISPRRIRPWTMLENNINQAACSAGAAVASAGLVAPIPALTMLTGQRLEWHWLALWVFSVCLVGIAAAIGIRRQMIVVDKLPFPSGIACAEMLREMYAHGREALARVLMMLGFGLLASGVKVVELLGLARRWPLPFSVGGYPAGAWTFSLDPTLLMVGVGGLIGWRAAWSLLLGSALAYLVVSPPLLRDRSLRLEVDGPLVALPESVRAALDRADPLSFDAERRRLEWKGVMTPEQRAAYLALSDEPRYREAVARLYGRSQPALELPLAAPPALGGLPVKHDAARGVLRVRGGLSPDALDALRTLDASPAFQAALDRVALAFDYHTTRDLQISEPLGTLPPGLIIPRADAVHLRFDRSRQRLVAIGRMPAAVRDHLSTQCDRLLAGGRAPAPQVEAFRAALQRLYERSQAGLMPPGAAIPPELAARVELIDGGAALRARGPLSAADARALRGASADADLQAAAAGLAATAAYRLAAPNFVDLNAWLLWPGVTLMVVASLVYVSFSWRAMLGFFGRRGAGDATADPQAAGDTPFGWFVAASIVALSVSVLLQSSLFGIGVIAAVVGVLLSFVLALVAARVSGETNTTPVGAMGKITQLAFAVITPNNPVPNLMTANVTGGAASQCADLLHDLKTGYLIGASPRWQALGQAFGALAGALVGSAVYLVLVPEPAEQLMTEQFPAPAVAAWKGVAEVFMIGLSALPPQAVPAMAIAAIAGVVLPLLERFGPKRVRGFVPSPASVGLAFVIPGYNAISMFLGGFIALLLSKAAPGWSSRYLVAACAGIIAGESLTGVGDALRRIFVAA